MSLLCVVFFLLSLLRFAAATRLETCIQLVGFQGVLLFLLSLQGTGHAGNVLLPAVETLFVKGVFLPLFLMHMLRRNRVYRDVEPFIPQLGSLVAAIVCLLAGSASARQLQSVGVTIEPLLFATAVNTMLLALFIISTRRKLISHVIGFVLFENGTFLLSLSLFRELPSLVQLGVLLDAFVALFLFGLFIRKVSSSFADLDAGQLTRLKD